MALRGRVLLDRGDVKSALSLLQAAIAGSEKGLDSLMWLAESLEKLGRDSEAFSALCQANRLYPNDSELTLRLAKILVVHGEYGPAVGFAKQASVLAPENGEAHLVLAQALIESGASDEAHAPLLRALGYPSSAATAAGMLGYWYQARGEFSEARDLFRRSIDLEPRQSLAYYGWVQGSRVSGEESWLVEAAKEMVGDKSISVEDSMYLQYALGKALADLGEYENSMARYDLANDAAFRLNLGERPFRAKRYAQILDATISTFTTDFFRTHRGLGSSSRRPIFVIGMMRSGTTLVEQILSSHSEVAAGSELPFWLDVSSKVFDVDRRVVDLKRVPRLQAEYGKVLDSVHPTATRVTDKMPQNFQALGLIHLAFPKAPIVHVRRNPIDTCLSIYTTPYQESPDFAHSKDSIVFAYRQYQRLMAHWRKVLPPEQFLEIDYEDLTLHPERVTRQLLSFCKLEWSEDCLRPQDNKRVVTTPSLCAVRKPINRDAVERWRVYEPWLGSFAKLLPSTSGALPCFRIPCPNTREGLGGGAS